MLARTESNESLDSVESAQSFHSSNEDLLITENTHPGKGKRQASVFAKSLQNSDTELTDDDGDNTCSDTESLANAPDLMPETKRDLVKPIVAEFIRSQQLFISVHIDPIPPTSPSLVLRQLAQWHRDLLFVLLSGATPTTDPTYYMDGHVPSQAVVGGLGLGEWVLQSLGEIQQLHELYLFEHAFMLCGLGAESSGPSSPIKKRPLSAIATSPTSPTATGSSGDGMNNKLDVRAWPIHRLMQITSFISRLAQHYPATGTTQLASTDAEHFTLLQTSSSLKEILTGLDSLLHEIQFFLSIPHMFHFDKAITYDGLKKRIPKANAGNVSLFRDDGSRRLVRRDQVVQVNEVGLEKWEILATPMWVWLMTDLVLFGYKQSFSASNKKSGKNAKSVDSFKMLHEPIPLREVDVILLPDKQVTLPSGTQTLVQNILQIRVGVETYYLSFPEPSARQQWVHAFQEKREENLRKFHRDDTVHTPILTRRRSFLERAFKIKRKSSSSDVSLAGGDKERERKPSAGSVFSLRAFAASASQSGSTDDGSSTESSSRNPLKRATTPLLGAGSGYASGSSVSVRSFVSVTSSDLENTGNIAPVPPMKQRKIGGFVRQHRPVSIQTQLSVDATPPESSAQQPSTMNDRSEQFIEELRSAPASTKPNAAQLITGPKLACKSFCWSTDSLSWTPTGNGYLFVADSSPQSPGVKRKLKWIPVDASKGVSFWTYASDDCMTVELPSGPVSMSEFMNSTFDEIDRDCVVTLVIPMFSLGRDEERVTRGRRGRRNQKQILSFKCRGVERVSQFLQAIFVSSATGSDLFDMPVLELKSPSVTSMKSFDSAEVRRVVGERVDALFKDILEEARVTDIEPSEWNLTPEPIVYVREFDDDSSSTLPGPSIYSRSIEINDAKDKGDNDLDVGDESEVEDDGYRMLGTCSPTILPEFYMDAPLPEEFSKLVDDSCVPPPRRESLFFDDDLLVEVEGAHQSPAIEPQSAGAVLGSSSGTRQQQNKGKVETLVDRFESVLTVNTAASDSGITGNNLSPDQVQAMHKQAQVKGMGMAFTYTPSASAIEGMTDEQVASVLDRWKKCLIQMGEFRPDEYALVSGLVGVNPSPVSPHNDLQAVDGASSLAE